MASTIAAAASAVAGASPASSIFKLLIGAAKIAIPEGFELYHIIHDTASDKVAIIRQVDASIATLQEIIEDWNEIKKAAQSGEPLIK